MRIEPRQQLLEIWQATARASYDAKSQSWKWGGRRGSNSISDAEQLLCILLPATEIAAFRLDRPNETDLKIVAALRPMGSATEIPRLLVRAVNEYLVRYEDPKDGTPSFAGGPAFNAIDEANALTDEQLGLDVVESYAASIQLCLAALGFAKILKESITRTGIKDELEDMERRANKRLSSALAGLLRSFAISVFPVDSPQGRALLRTVNQSHRPVHVVAEELRIALQETAARLRDLDVGNAPPEALDNPEILFECGWSWGIAVDAPKVRFGLDGAEQRPGYALSAPYLYFTVVALDGILELDSNRTRLLNLLDEDQLQMANALRLRWELTQTYWATIASFGRGRWPLEDIPWRTTDDAESDFFSLLVVAITARQLARRRGTDTSFGRLGLVLTELANRGRLTRRPFHADPAIGLHHPGVTVELSGSEMGGTNQLTWIGTDFAPLLLKRTVQVAELIADVEERGRLLDLAGDVWNHLNERRLQTDPGKDLWDQPGEVFPEVPTRFEHVSWHHTVRVVESLVVAARMADSDPLQSVRLSELGDDLLAEAEHLFDKELLLGSTEGGPAIRQRLDGARQRVQRAREIIGERPGSALALLVTALTELDQLEAARQDAQRV
jgi:hypothetical protein